MPLPDALTPEEMKITRVIVEILGPEKAGKTHLALTAPGPLLYVDLNNRAEGTIEKFVPEKQIHQYKVDFTEPIRTQACMKELQDAETGAGLLKEIAEGKHGIRSVVIDAWDEMRTAEVANCYGKIQTTGPGYIKVNRNMRKIIERFKSSNVNLILISQVKKEIISNEKADDGFIWSGKYERKGLYDTGALVNVTLQPELAPNGKVTVTVMNCGYDIHKNGLEFVEPACDLPMILATLIDGSKPGDWR